MRAENLLLLLDECDELQLLLRESLRPGAFGVLMLLLSAGAVTWVTASLTLGLTTLMIGGWLALCLAWINERRVSLPVETPLNRRHY